MFCLVILFNCVVRFYLRLQHTCVDLVVQREELSEQNFLVLVLDCRVLFEEYLLDFIQLNLVYLLN